MMLEVHLIEFNILEIISDWLIFGKVAVHDLHQRSNMSDGQLHKNPVVYVNYR